MLQPSGKMARFSGSRKILTPCAPYYLLAGLIALAALAFILAPLSLPDPPPPRPFVDTPGYLTLSPQLGRVRVTPWAGSEMRSPSSETDPGPVSPFRDERSAWPAQNQVPY